MRSYLTIGNITAAVSGAVLAGLALNGAAHALSEAAYRYSTTQTGYLVVPAAAFVPESNTAGYSNSGTELVLTTPGSACFVAPVNLPEGAKMTQVMMWYAQNGATSQALRLKNLSLSTLGDSAIATVALVDTGGAFEKAHANITDPALQPVHNAQNSYYLLNCLGAGESFLAARVTYTYTTAGD